MNPKHIAALQHDWFFHVWNERESIVRWMTAFDTMQDDVDAFVASIRGTATA
jgi:threonine aldolase